MGAGVGGKGQQCYSQLHDKVEVAATLIDVVQGHDVGVLDPEKRNEYCPATTPVPAPLARQTVDLAPPEKDDL